MKRKVRDLEKDKNNKTSLQPNVKLVLVEVLDKEGGTNIADKYEVQKVSEMLLKLLPGFYRKYWPLVLMQNRVIESQDDFIKRVEQEVERFNQELEAKEKKINVKQEKVSYVS